MPYVHYKFSSKLSYDTVVFDGHHITLNELKRLIMCKEKLRAGDCDLQITNAQTKEEYTDSDSMIPRNISVIVRRIPSSSTKTHSTEQSEVHRAFGASRAMDDHSSTSALSSFSKIRMANLVDADLSEEDKIKAMIYQSTYDSMNVHTKPHNALPVNYTCYRCGNPGHHIRNCPAKGDKNTEGLRIKKSTGIPRSFMVEVDDPNMKGVKLTNYGRYAIPAIDAEAYAIGKKEKPPFLAKEQPESEDPIPSELLCLICDKLLTDAVVIPCCGNSYCDECIRTALLESEFHICPTCDQSMVSPDNLIANKFLRQTVENFKREQGCAKSLRCISAASQSQSLTPSPTPVPTVPPLPLPMESQPQKPQQSSHNQQVFNLTKYKENESADENCTHLFVDSLLDDPKAANIPSLSQGPGVPPATTDPATDNDTAGTSLQPQQSQLELPENKTEGKTCDDSASAVSVKVSNKDPTDAPSQPLTPDNHTLVAEQPQTVNVSQDNQQHASSGPTPVFPESSVSLESSSSSSACPSGGKTESNPQQLSTISTSSSSTYSTTPPLLSPSLVFNTCLSALQSHSAYPPRYPSATPIWTLPAPQGALSPSLCSSTITTTTTTTTPSPLPLHPLPRPSGVVQVSEKDRSPHGACSYRRSSSRSKSSRAKASYSYSRSSSRSVSRSRSRSRSRHFSPYCHHKDHTRPHQSCSYSYSYKHLRSPTPSSSSSPRRHYQSRSKAPPSRKDQHHSKRISSSSNHSRRRAERSGREAVRSEDSVSRNTDTIQTGSLELDRECCLELDRECCLELDRECCLQWKKEYKEWYEKYFSSFSQFNQLPFSLLGLPPPLPPPQCVSTEGSRKQSHINSDSHYQPQGRLSAEIDGCSNSSELSSDSRSPPSHSSGDSHSPPSQSSTDSRSTLSEDRAQLRVFPERHNEKTRHKPVTLKKSKEKMKPPGPSTDKKQLKKLEDSTPMKKLEPPDVVYGTHDSRKDKKRHSSGTQASKDGTQIQDKATISTALETNQTVPKQDQPLKKECQIKFIESNLEKEDGCKRSKNLDSKKRERQHKGKPNKEPDGMDKGEDKSPQGGKTSDSGSVKNRKRKGEDLENLSGELQSSTHVKIKRTEESENPMSEFLKPLEREKQKTEKKTLPLTGKDIWEEGMKVKPQIKMSININLDGKRKKENTGKHNFLENLTGKSQENLNYAVERERNKEEDLWHCALIGVEEHATGKEEEEWVRDGDRDREMGESQKEQEDRGETWREGLMERVEMRMKDEDTVTINALRSNEGHQDAPYAKLDDGSSTSVVGSCEGKESQRTEVKPLEKYTQDRWMELVHNQVSQSKCETEDDGKIRGHTDREKDRNSAWSWSHRSVAPSSDKDRVRNIVSAGADREMRKERERKRERERSKEQIREEGIGRDRAQERECIASSATRTVPTSSQFYSFSTSQDAERRERQHGGSQGSNKSSSCPSGKFTGFRNSESSTRSRAPELATENAYKTQRDLSLNLKYKDKDCFHYQNIHQDPSGCGRNKGKAPGTQHSQPFLSHSYRKGRDLQPFESSRYPQRESPSLGLMQVKESKVGKGELKPIKPHKLVKEGKRKRENRGMLAGQGGGSQWEDETNDKVDGEGEQGEEVELEDGETLSSVGSSPSEGKSKDDKGTEKV